MAKLPDNLEDAERFQRLLIEPMLRGMQEKLDTHHAEVTAQVASISAALLTQDQRIQKLESGQKKALIGWSAYATLCAAGLSYCWSWFKQHFRIT